jgi:N-acetylated-alpha-linked acidic dipeptidase
MDSAVSGAYFNASSVPSLWKLIRDATRDVRDPKTGKTLYQAWQERSRQSNPEAELTDPSTGTDTKIAEARISALGSGSDYTPFLQHLGIASLDMSFSGEYGVYHSAYDSFYWMSKFGDPTFQYHVAAAQVWGTIALRLSDASGLPFDYLDYAVQLQEFLIEAQRAATRRKLADAFDAKALDEAIEELEEEAERIDKRRRETMQEVERSRVQANDSHPRAVARLRRINDALVEAERALTDEQGLRGRAWYKHQIYAPGYYTGYAAQPLPDLLQAIDDGSAPNARDASVRIAGAIRRAADVLKKARD